MKLLVTGASGLVGSAVVRLSAEQGNDVTAIVGGFAGPIAGATRKLAIDLKDPHAVDALVANERPDAIVNCAAVSVPEACEADPVTSQTMNVALPETLAIAAQRLGARLLHISSEQVFDGNRDTAYRTTDPVTPINVYARQKVESEQRVHAAAPELAATIRAPLLMGNSAAGRRSTHERLLGDWAAGKPARLYADEYRQPCTAENLASVLVELCARRDLRGIFHWAGAELLSRYELGARIRDRFALSADHAPIVSVTRADNPAAAAKRQACLALDVSALAAALGRQPETLAEQLAKLVVPQPCEAWYAQVGPAPHRR